jgi:catechol 2,3-dioxygenase-like lactoylglutathione lyase family enzyme
MKPQVTALDHLVLSVADIDATASFYRDVLGMEVVEFPVADGTRRKALRFGAQKIDLHTAAAPFKPHAANPTPGSADLCLLTKTPLADWQSHLHAAGIAIEAGPIARTGATGPLMSIYLRDPDGNLIEVSIQNPL